MKAKANGEKIVGYFLGICLAVFLTYILIFLGQQLLWQLRRADCGSYTVIQEKEGNIPTQCRSTVK